MYEHIGKQNIKLSKQIRITSYLNITFPWPAVVVEPVRIKNNRHVPVQFMHMHLRLSNISGTKKCIRTT